MCLQSTHQSPEPLHRTMYRTRVLVTSGQEEDHLGSTKHNALLKAEVHGTSIETTAMDIGAITKDVEAVIDSALQFKGRYMRHHETAADSERRAMIMSVATAAVAVALCYVQLRLFVGLLRQRKLV